MFAAQPAQAAAGEHILNNPQVLKLRQEPTSFTDLPSQRRLFGKEVDEEGTQKEFDLKVEYIESHIRNPGKGEGEGDKVKLRGYVGTDTSDETPYVAPTIEVNPGDTVRVNLKNNLPIVPDCKVSPDEVNKPHCFNGTNLHTHGLWISPTGNSDNVLLSINPGEEFQYEFNIPQEHPAGTFWYHPHRHGSTALQVASGMAGALIVRGDRKPEQLPFLINPPLYSHGDIDTLLKGVNDGNGITEHVLVLQQIQYACKDNENDIWDCSGKTGKIESYDLFGPPTWKESGRYTSINGEVIPTIQAKQGEIERWRIIHAGVRDTISLKFRKAKEGRKAFTSSKANDNDDWIKENCPGAPIKYFVIADDGLTRSQAWETDLTTLQPGYRSDALVVFPEDGDYCVIDEPVEASAAVSREAESGRLLAMVKVESKEDAAVDDIADYVQGKLTDAAEKVFSSDEQVKNKVIADLKDNLKLSLFTPHPDIKDNEVANTKGQELAFFIDTLTPPAVKFEVSNTIGSYFHPKPFDPNRIDRKLKLGDAEEWTLESYFVGHPFHIHVNPFQIVKILNPEGKDVSCKEEDRDSDCVADGNDPQYTALKGVWKDTLWVKGMSPGSTYPEGVYTIVVRTRYQRYIGDFVLHCHILDHEDQGMMQRISIVLPEELYVTNR
ncbi:MAG: multicopper oxidase domain-containing protein [Symploca sp. SIO2E6]|nr:multicopper oxidase domain-containing protein [Symploca sp. SIO2E6]